MICFPNAKINIGLNITEKRIDGFHNIESCFYPIGLSDILEIVEADVLSFSSSGIEIPGSDAQNLVLRAYHLLKADYAIPFVNIHLHKIIPIGAGLGGGSSDAAFALKYLSQLFELNLTEDQLVNYARKLGSDCAFFIANTPVLAFEKGDEFKPVNFDLSKYFILLVYPNLHISTAEAYSGVSPLHPMVSLEILLNDKNKWSEIKNDFEKSLFPKYPLLQSIKTKLYDAGAIYASMTGSGSSIYGIFEESPEGLAGDFSDYFTWQGSFAQNFF